MAEELDEFDKAFGEVVAALEAAPTTPPPETPPATLPITPPPETPPATPPETPPATPPVTPVTPPATPPVTPVTPPATPPVTPPPEAPDQKAARETFEASIKPYEPTAEEKAALDQFKKDFPNEAVAVESRLKSVDRDINARVYQAVQNILSQIDPRLRSVESTVTTSTREQHFTALHQAHPDYDTVIGKVPAWIKTLPSYAQAGAQAVYDGGTTQEVLALVTDYKKSAGIAPTPPATSPATPPAKPKPDGADLTPVSSRRPVTTPKGEADPNDFDGAFAEAAAALG